MRGTHLPDTDELDREPISEAIETPVLSIGDGLANDSDADLASQDAEPKRDRSKTMTTSAPLPPATTLSELILQEDDDHDPLSLPIDQDYNDFSSDESLQDSEDIDFEFVYALHTFVATVEGQANATKGDTMVLLDDSNSYWWLVRVVKDSSIGTSHRPCRWLSQPI